MGESGKRLQELKTEEKSVQKTNNDEEAGFDKQNHGTANASSDKE